MTPPKPDGRRWPTDPDEAPRLLIVDDEEAILRALQRELRGRGFHITVMSDPQAALEAVRRESFDLVISDNRMPGMSGIELLDKVERMAPETLRFILTGYTDLEAAVGAMNTGGIHRLIAKPWDRDQLLNHIHDGLETLRLRRSNERLSRELEEKNALLSPGNEALRNLAVRDPLTGLYNRHEFELDLERQIKRYARDHQPFCLALGDIDHFRDINDTFGYPLGDEVLKGVARLFHSALREEMDTVYRYEGEEFALILRNTGSEGARSVFSRLIDRFDTHGFELPTGRRPVTLSFGVGCYTSAWDQDVLVAQVDSALSQAKQEGRNRFILLGNGSAGSTVGSGAPD